MRESYDRFRIWVLTLTQHAFNNSYVFTPDEKAIVPGELYDLTVSAEVTDSGCRIKEIARAVAYMHEDLRIPLSMFMGGYRYEEIAQKLNVPEGTVKGRILVARQELHSILACARDN